MLNLLRLAIKHKKAAIKIVKNKKTKRLLLVCINLNIIFGWSSITTQSQNYYNVYVNWSCSKKITTILKPSKQISLKHNQLLNTGFKINNASMFLTTNMGVISVAEALQYKCGGILLFCLV